MSADVTFPCMGSEVRLLVEGADAEASADASRGWLENYDQRVSRFRADSDLCRLNADPRDVVPASLTLRVAVRAALWAAERTDGLVDPTMLAALERAGYAASRAGLDPAPLAEALAAAPPRRPAGPDPRARWREITVDHDARTIARPPGLTIDNGGTGKGLAADLVGRTLSGRPRWAVDCGGDIRIGGDGTVYDVEIRHPLTGGQALVVPVGAGAVCTSGIDVRVWRRADGGFAHHLLDPATGEPAWTGLVGTTAIAPTALEAETLAKSALLSGPGAGRALLTEHGGILFHDDGGVEVVGPLPRPSVRRVTAGDLRRFVRAPAGAG
jgi:thiamine biosynthesis lipoprotein